ncbi:ribosome biogenesis protein Nop53/GLTSCR2 [Hyaloraphidium curvatum]|nr:ribosome biogenesis protein Nop53/GLTSCR2 [Hyaloraphidium curvatum]
MTINVPVQGRPALHKARVTQPSRKGKKAWRKNIDITEHDAALEDRSNEKRLGGKRLHEIANDSLFVIDAQGDDKERHKLRHFRLRIDEILKPDSKLAPLRPQEPKAGAGTKRKLSKAELQKVEKTKAKLARTVDAKAKPSEPSSVADPWAPSAEEADPVAVNDYLAPVRTVPVKRPRTFDRRAPSSLAPSVTPSDPGTSYNPTFEDHQRLLQQAVDVEVAKEKQREQVQQKLAYPPELDLLPEDAEIASLGGEESVDDAGGLEDEAVGSQSAQKRLTKSEKNKRKRKLEAAAEEESARLRKKQAREIAVLPSLLKEIKKKEKANARKQAVPRKDESDPKRLGPYKLKEPSLDLHLTEELSESLRALKPEGNLLKDRFSGLQKRKLIEPRVRVVRSRKYKLRTYEKPAYRFLS